MPPLAGLIESVDFPILRVAANGRVWGITPQLLQKLGMPYEQVISSSIVKLVSVEFFQDLVLKRTLMEPFSGYRTQLRRSDGQRISVEAAGYAEPEGGNLIYTLIFMETGKEATLAVDMGRFEHNVQAQKLLRMYISKQLVQRVKSAVSQGLDEIPNEARDLTFMFADLVSYTALTEQSSDDQVVEMLNLFIGATSGIVLHNGGFVDKIMGDSVFAVFESPLSAVLSGIEVQKQFNMLNFFRVAEGEPEVLLRIGVNSGHCILASIGSADFRELTFIGDAVNAASRLEKACTPGAILASTSVLEPIRDRITTTRSVELQVKGKRQAMHAEYVNSVTVTKDGREIVVDVDESVF